jgi:hypothetical protein
MEQCQVIRCDLEILGQTISGVLFTATDTTQQLAQLGSHMKVDENVQHPSMDLSFLIGFVLRT